MITTSFLRGCVLGALVLGVATPAAAAQSGLIANPTAALSIPFSVHLPLRNAAQLEALIRVQSDPRSPQYRHFLTVDQFRANYGPAPQTLARAAAALRARGFTVTGSSTQSLTASGPRTAIERAFQTTLGTVRDAAGRTHAASITPFVVPAELGALGATVTGLGARIHMHPDSRRVPLNRYQSYGTYWFDDLKQAYTYPSDRTFDGKGATIGVLMSSDVLDSDIDLYFAHEKYEAVSGKHRLPLIHESLYGGGGVDGDGFAEANIDVQTSQGSAPGAQVRLYNIPDLSDSSIIAGYIAAVEENNVDVLSSSFGECDLFYAAAFNNGVDQTGILRTFDALFSQGNAQGITFVAASGDSAGLGCADPSYLAGQNGSFKPGAEFPGDDPHVTSVGGTNLGTTAPSKANPLRSSYVAENAYADPEVPYDPYGTGGTLSGGYWGSGSGASFVWDRPWYQYLVNTGSARRTVPDISMQMGGCPGGISLPSCPLTERSAGAYAIDGAFYGYIGTSLSAPEFAGLLAVKIGATGRRLGNVNGYIYQLAATDAALPPSFPQRYYHQGIPGYNGVVKTLAGPRGYSPILGVGTPYAQNFLGFPQLPLAGDPQTLSNP